MNILSWIWGKTHGVKITIRDEWYNYFAYVSSEGRHRGIMIFDKSGNYIQCNGVGSLVTYKDENGRLLTYKIIKMRTKSGGDWLCKSDIYSCDLKFVKPGVHDKSKFNLTSK